VGTFKVKTAFFFVFIMKKAVFEVPIKTLKKSNFHLKSAQGNLQNLIFRGSLIINRTLAASAHTQQLHAIFVFIKLHVLRKCSTCRLYLFIKRTLLVRCIYPGRNPASGNRQRGGCTATRIPILCFYQNIRPNPLQPG
jgi:hypothetical protein